MVWTQARDPQGAALSEPLFTTAGGTFVPSEHTRGPWDPDAMHGGAPCALLAHELQHLAGEMNLARLTFEFLGPVPLAPVTVETRVLKPGSRFQLLEAAIASGGRDYLLARAVALAPGHVALPDIARWRDDPQPGPDEGAPKAFPSPPDAPEKGFHRTGMEIRWIDGSVADVGPGRGWFRLAFPLLEDVDVAPVARACAAADFGNGASQVLGWRTHLFVNTDLTVSLLRPPAGEWVLLDAVTRIDESGVGWAASTLHDEHGPIGFSQQTLFVTELTDR